MPLNPKWVVRSAWARQCRAHVTGGSQPREDRVTDQSAPPTPHSSVAAVVVLAAGAGTRMKSAKSKLLHEVAGRSLVSHAIRSGESIGPHQLVVVVGMLREQVEPHLAEVAPEVTIVPQSEDGYGTGHAV